MATYSDDKNPHSFKLEGDVNITVREGRHIDLTELAAISQAASLKRIADSLQNPHFGHGLVEQLAMWRLQDVG